MLFSILIGFVRWPFINILEVALFLEVAKKRKALEKRASAFTSRERSSKIYLLSRATVFAGTITPNVNKPLANFFRHRLVGDVFLAKRGAWHAASDILLAFVFGLFFF